MKIKLLPSSFEENGNASRRQHTTCFLVDGCVAIDAGSLANAVTAEERKVVRDIVISHAHLDHIAGLPLYIDDLFATLESPIRVHAAAEVIEILERDIFNWSVYPRFSELTNDNGPVMEYKILEPGSPASIRHLTVLPVAVNHKVPTCGFILSDGSSEIAITGDTASNEEFWRISNRRTDLKALFVECAFPDEMSALAEVSHHLTPSKLAFEIEKFDREDCPIFAINLKPMYRDAIIEQLRGLHGRQPQIMEVGREYIF